MPAETVPVVAGALGEADRELDAVLEETDPGLDGVLGETDPDLDAVLPGVRVAVGSAVTLGDRPADPIADIVAEALTGRLLLLAVADGLAGLVGFAVLVGLAVLVGFGVRVTVGVAAGQVKRNVGSGVALGDAPGAPRPGGGVRVAACVGVGDVGVGTVVGVGVGTVVGAGRWLRDGTLVGGVGRVGAAVVGRGRWVARGLAVTVGAAVGAGGLVERRAVAVDRVGLPTGALVTGVLDALAGAACALVAAAAAKAGPAEAPVPGLRKANTATATEPATRTTDPAVSTAPDFAGPDRDGPGVDPGDGDPGGGGPGGDVPVPLMRPR